MIGQEISHYRILSKIGEGGMGVVYLAEDTSLGRRVAVKTLAAGLGKQHYRARFIREARAVSMLNHPNIAAVYDFGESPDGHPFIVMELISGHTLGDLIGRGELNLTTSISILEKTAEALAEAHRHKIIHRDIKPTNIGISERGEVKVLDFGLAKHLDGNASDMSYGAPSLPVTQTRESVRVGTPLYLSPEQALGLTLDTRSDIFSLGALLYECLTGRPTFAGKNEPDICAKVIREDPPPPSRFNPQVPPELDRITLKALSKKPQDRYQSVEELIEELKVLRLTLRDSGGKSVPRKKFPTASQQPAHTSALMSVVVTLRRPRVLGAAFLTTLIAALLIVWGSSLRSRSSLGEPDPVAKGWYDRGAESLRNGSYYTASKRLQKAVEIDNNYVLAHTRLAEAWSELDYSDSAKDEIILAGRLAPDQSKLAELDALYLQAVTDTVMRNFPKAIESYRRIEQLAPEGEKVAALLDLGRAYEKNEELDNAIGCYLEAARRDPQYATAFLCLGIAYGRKQDFKNADATFDEAQSLYQTMGDFEGVTEVLYQRGVLLNKLRDIGGARAQLTQALDKARANGFLPQQILALLQLSGVSFGAGELAQAQRQASEAVALARSNGLENLTTRGLIDLGNTFFSSGKHAEAEKYYAQALEFARRYKGRRNEARAVFMLGSSLINRGQIDEGLPYAEQAYNFYRQGGYRKEAAQAALLFGRAKRDLGDYEAALQIFRRRLQQAEESNDRSLIAFSHKEIGVVLAQSERYPEALQHFELCSSINNILGDKETAAYSSALQADMLWRIGRFAEARDILNRLASDTNKQDKSFNSVAAHAHLIKGKLELSYLRFPSAMDAGRKAFAMVERRSDHTAIDALLILGLAQAYSGTARAGVKSCRDAVVASEQVKDQWRLSASMLALGETLLLNGDAEGALQNAMRAREGFERRGQRDSLWRAWLLAARAGHLLKDEATARDYSMRAADLFSSLPQFWGKDAYEGYLTRPDIRQERQRLDALLAVGRSPERNH